MRQPAYERVNESPMPLVFGAYDTSPRTASSRGSHMLRTATASAIGLLGAVIMLLPASAVAADTGTTTTTGTSTTTTTTSATTSTGAVTTTTAANTTTTTARRAHRATAAPRVSQAGASQNATVTISTNCTYFCFAPEKTTVVAGGTVTWVDKSSTRHNITRCDPANCSGVTGGTGVDATFTAAHLGVPAGGSARFTFAQPGTYVYYCAIHGYGLMHGTITVVAAEVTTVPPLAAPVVAAPATAAGPHLASTGSGTGGALAAALILLVVGLTATTFRLGRRYS
jgi:plastocyanin